MASLAGSDFSGRRVEVDEAQVRSHVDEVVRESVEETLNGLLEAEADQLCGAERCERSPDRIDTRAGSYERGLQTKAGQVKLKVPLHRLREVMAMLKAIHAQEDRDAAEKKSVDVVEKLRALKLHKAATSVSEGVSETLRYMAYPREHGTRIRTNNALERLMREIRRRTRVVGAFPDGNSALMLVAARLRHVAGTRWGTRKYLDMERLKAESGGAS